jgi:cell division protein FtsI/penicillin-binding protein 2
MMKKRRILAISVMLLVQLTALGWPPTEAAHPASPGGKSASGLSNVQRKKQSTTRRRSSRRQSSRRRLARLNAALQQAARAAIARDDLRGEDMEVRTAALKALGSYAGSVVVIDSQSGRIYSIVNQEWALGKGCTPCSTIKPFMALAGLKEGLIDTNVPVAMGQSALSVSLINALAYSDNLYFQRIGAQLGLEKIRDYAKAFGLGQPTGINLPGETAGRLPQMSNLKNGVGYAASHGEGFEVTPLQLAVFTAALANGGFVYQPHVVRGDTDEASSGYDEGNGGGDRELSLASDRVEPVLRGQIPMTEDERTNIIAGMVGAVEFGTARYSANPGIQVAGKTGTCRGDDHFRLGLFASFATLERPTLVVVVVTKGLGQSGSVAAQAAGKIYEQLADRFNLRRRIQSQAATVGQ